MKIKDAQSDEQLKTEICQAVSKHKRSLREAYADDLATGKLTIDDMVGIPLEMVKSAVVKLRY